MQTYIQRTTENTISSHLQNFPAVALLGARQVGKSTLAKHIIAQLQKANQPHKTLPSQAQYLDLEDPRDFAKLQDPLAYLEANKDQLICIDEIQRYPALFMPLRSFIDRNNNARPGQLLLLGSASRDLIRQSSETLAGRISYIEVNPFDAKEVAAINSETSSHLKKLWLQGGYPPSFFLEERVSFDWRLNYIRTFLERDIPALGFNIPPETLKRLWTMLAHLNGSVMNMSTLAQSMGVSVPTIKKYLDLLEGTFVTLRLPPFYTNTKKRLTKSPKYYIRDSGLIHALLGIESYNDLLGHPALGNSFESMIISSLIANFPRHKASFYRSSSGAEIDLILEKGGEILAIEIKASSAPKISKGFFEGLKVLSEASQRVQAFCIAQVDSPFPLKGDLWVYDINSFLDKFTTLG